MRDADTNHANRGVVFSEFDGVGRIIAQCSARDYADVKEIWERYVQAEWHADWDATVAEHGDQACTAKMPRTNAQRGWDALRQMAVDAASTAPDAVAPEPVVGIVCDHTTFENELRRMGLIPQRDSEPATEVPFEFRRCETVSGIPITPTEAVLAAIHGRIRRVVFNTAGVVIDYGRRRRLFNGPAREAVMLQSRTCVHPGCTRPASWCQIDHTLEWSKGGHTNPGNGGPMCERHNLRKNHGYKVWRDPGGSWHTYRPDGTEIAPAPPPPGTAPPQHAADAA